ncbi:ABC transporter ATP-binding protein [Nitrincola tapanii]|uniref:ATP-binding cassette domain-containing protein n=1 Tax=Nitrincola tapanii TaxID=1708751 RepID=A0A5A9W6U7_9GAMM|nr:ABC transporter ATP-binding protein [Nitrincola tapanii]KAA0876422.1 ATP-binding cassette domain-containing protein [Nitrincola tapanii]
MSIEVRDLSFHYAQRAALHDLNFSLKTGEFAALLGPNGAGKTTLFSLLTRLHRLQQGQILIAGIDLDVKPRQVMRHLGVVFQQSTLDLDLSVLQNLQYHGALHGLSAQETRQRALKALEPWQLADRLHERVRNLNGGHRRRVEIARALLHQPSVLLLDEATTGLDTRARQTLNEHVRELCQQEGLSVLWTTHLIDEIQPKDRVLILHQGQLLADDQAAHLCQQTGQAQMQQAFEQITGLSKEMN